MDMEPNREMVASSVRPIVERLLAARAVHETLASHMEQVDKNILSGSIFLDEYTGSRVVEPCDMWKIREEDSSRFFSLRDDYIAENFEVPERGYCPALIAESRVRELKKELIDASAQFFPGLTYSAVSRNTKNYEKAVELLTSLALSA